MTTDSDGEFDPTADHPTALEPGGNDSDAGESDAEADTDPGSLSAELHAGVAKAVEQRIARELKALADTAFEELLTVELYEQLAAATARQMITALDAQSAAATADAAGPVYTNLYDFVAEVILTDYRREVTEGNQHAWCPDWPLHGEAVRRFGALWRAWEHLRKDPATGPSVWWKDHLDHHMGKLLDPHGPFEACSVRHGHTANLPPLPANPVDPALTGIPDDPITAPTTAAADTGRTLDHEGARP